METVGDPEGTTHPRCPACRLGTVVRGVCDRCGAAFGERQRCPHCNVVARVEPRISGGRTTWACAACGGPRIPNGFGGAAAGAALRKAKAGAGRATREQAARLLFVVMTAFTTLVLATAWPSSFVAKVVLALFAIVPAALALAAHTRARRASTAAAEATEKAWLLAAEDAAAVSRTGISAEELAEQLHVDPRRADALLTRLAVHDRTRIEIGDDAEVRYSVSPETMINVRLDLSEESADDEPLGEPSATSLKESR